MPDHTWASAFVDVLVQRKNDPTNIDQIMGLGPESLWFTGARKVAGQISSRGHQEGDSVIRVPEVER